MGKHDARERNDAQTIERMEALGRVELPTNGLGNIQTDIAGVSWNGEIASVYAAFH